MAFYSNFGPMIGPLQDRDVTGSIGVLPDREQHLPVGQATPLAHDGDGNALFLLRVHGQQLDGLWRLVGREFIPVAQEASQAPGRG